MIVVKDLKKNYNGLDVLKGIDLTINKGDVVCLVGPSGCGKSTFLRCLTRLEEPDGGTVMLDGKEITERDIDATRAQMGMVFQHFNLFPHLTVKKNITLAPVRLGQTEEDIAGSSQEEKLAFLHEMGIESTGLDNLIKASYDLLGLISFLTDGKKECRAWTIKRGTKAPQAAGKIHSDFERGFIRAQVISYDALADNNFDYAAVKAKGLQRTEGKEYVVNDGDVIEFLFNV